MHANGRINRNNDQRNRGSLITRHASRRMQGRGITDAAIDAALVFGRVVYTRGAVIHAIGRKEIADYARFGINLSAHDGVQVVCSHDGAVVTVYRNRNFRNVRTGLGRGRYHRSGRSRGVPA